MRPQPAVPVAGFRLVDPDMRRAGIGHVQLSAIGRKADAMRVAGTAELTVGLGVGLEADAQVEHQDAVGVVIADRDPTAGRIDGDAVRDVETFPEEDRIPRQAETRIQGDDVPGDPAGVVVADENFRLGFIRPQDAKGTRCDELFGKIRPMDFPDRIKLENPVFRP